MSNFFKIVIGSLLVGFNLLIASFTIAPQESAFATILGIIGVVIIFFPIYYGLRLPSYTQEQTTKEEDKQ